MKIKNLILAVIAVAGATVAASSAHAQFYNQGDLLLGVTGTGSQSYLIDLGPATNFVGQSLWYSETLSLGNINTDLNSLFGPNWATNPNVSWGIAGVGASNFRNLYVAQPEPGSFSYPYTLATAPSEGTSNAQAGPAGKINTVGGDAGQYETVSSNASDAVIQGNDANPITWASDATEAPAFGSFQNFLANDPTYGITNTALDLFSVPYATGANVGNPGTYDGTFTVSDAGAVSFTVVPEPSTYAAIVLGAAFLMFVSRRRAARA